MSQTIVKLCVNLLFTLITFAYFSRYSMSILSCFNDLCIKAYCLVYLMLRLKNNAYLWRCLFTCKTFIFLITSNVGLNITLVFTCYETAMRYELLICTYTGSSRFYCISACNQQCCLSICCYSLSSYRAAAFKRYAYLYVCAGVCLCFTSPLNTKTK